MNNCPTCKIPLSTNYNNICATCETGLIKQHHVGDENWNICENCKQVEGNTLEGFLCDNNHYSNN